MTGAKGGRVALGGRPPRAPTDPYVDTLDHTVPQVTPSLCRDLASAVADPLSAIHGRYGDTRQEFDASHVLPSNGRVTRCLASHPPGPRGPSSPASSVLSRHCDFLPAFPPRFVSFAWRYHGERADFAPAAVARGRRWAWGWSPGIPARVLFRGDGRISQVPGEPPFPFAHVLRPRPADASLTVAGRSRGPR